MLNEFMQITGVSERNAMKVSKLIYKPVALSFSTQVVKT